MSQAVLNEKTFQPGYAAMPEGAVAGTPPSAGVGSRDEAMTLGGTVSRTMLLLSLTVAFAFVGWNMAESVLTTSPWLMLGGFAILLMLSFAAVKNPRLAAPLGFLYAVLMGTWMGAISRVYDAQWDGIVLQAVGASIAVFLGCLILYGTGAVKVTNKFRSVVITATFGVLFLYLGALLLSLFGLDFLWSSNPLSIGVSVVVCIIASLNLFLDFDFIQKGAAMGAPRSMEWLAAFGLITTLVWLYLEILRLLALLQGNR